MPTADILGAPGFTGDPDRSWSDHRARGGFGGTSAASALVAGLIARKVAQDGQRMSGPEARDWLRGAVRNPQRSWSSEIGFGQAAWPAT